MEDFEEWSAAGCTGWSPQEVGLDQLRVVDTSIFPSVPRANAYLATIMVGEYMAERLNK